MRICNKIIFIYKIINIIIIKYIINKLKKFIVLGYYFFVDLYFFVLVLIL